MNACRLVVCAVAILACACTGKIGDNGAGAGDDGGSPGVVDASGDDRDGGVSDVDGATAPPADGAVIPSVPDAAVVLPPPPPDAMPGTPPPPPPTYPAYTCPPQTCPGGHLWGIGEPIAWNTFSYPTWDLDAQVAQVLALGAPIVRSWPASQYCFSSPETYDAGCMARVKDVIHRLRSAGVLVIQLENGPQPWITEGGTGKLPCRDYTPGSRYMQLLDRWQRMWVTLGTYFDNVDYWQIGNEWNAPGWLEPDGCDADGAFTFAERVAVSADLMFFARQGLKSVRPDAFTFSVSPAPVDTRGAISLPGIGTFFETLYADIESGGFPSTNPRDYFDGLAWHPYVWADPTASNWVLPNIAIHDVIARHGDGALPVWFSELGNGDFGDFSASAANADAMLLSHAMTQVYFPWLWGVTWFRMLNDPHAFWGGDIERSYGVMDSPEAGFNWKVSAFTMWSLNANPPGPGRVAAFEFTDRGSLSGFTPVNVDSIQNTGGWLLGTASVDAQLVAPAFGLDPTAARHAEITLASWSGTAAQLFFTTVDAPDLQEPNSVSFALIADGKPHKYVLDLGAVPGWTGIVTGFRLDPTDAPGQFMVDAIRFVP